MRRLFYWFPALAWAVLLFFASSLPQVPGDPGLPDWISHSAAYFVLAIFCSAGFSGSFRLEASRRVLGQSWLATVLYGLTDEFHQRLVPGRVSSWRDVFFDALGALLAVLSLWLLGRFGSARRGEG